MNKPGNILFFILVFLLQLVISDYLNLGPWVCLTLVPFLILHIPLSRNPHWVMLAAFGIGLGLDILSAGVPGMNAFAAVLTAAPRKFFYRTLLDCVSVRPAGFIAIRFAASTLASTALSLLLAIPLQNRY